MENGKFIEDESIKDNCSMLLKFTITDENYKANDGYKDETVRKFMDLIQTDMYANEIEVVHPDFDTENDRIINLTISLKNGKMSKNLIREAVNKGRSHATANTNAHASL